MPPFLIRSSNRGATTTTQGPPAASVVINMANVANSTTEPVNVDGVKGKVETLFGPPVGVGGTAVPEWTVLAGRDEMNQDKEEELTMDVVQGWVKRSKEEANKPVATTTLQALVNLKQPTIRLTPLSSSSEDHPPSTAAAHGLDFDFDCDGARCAISVRVIVPAPDEDEGKSKLSTASLFERIVDGGFGKTFKFDEHRAILELDKLDIARSSATETPAVAHTEVTAARPNAESVANNSYAHNRKRFSAFSFRRRSMALGPALEVVDADAEAQAVAAAVRASRDGEHDEDNPSPAGAAEVGAVNPSTSKVLEASENAGVKAVIRLEALDENDKLLASRNAQLTYLHIIRISTSHESDPTEPAHWVVKVVKREAIIGTHTFRLQEIYGLASSANAAPPNPNPAEAASYPPSAAAPNVSYDAPATECVLCLSSPREVVLLPCRHLVACRECAVNMVEFGAGGVLTHEAEATNATDTTAVETGAAGETGAAAGTSAAAEATAPPVIPERPRRKRKAKGWFCPVCRQPYTALLRITTTAPGKRLSEDSFSHAPSIPPSAVLAPVNADASGASANQATSTDSATGKLGGLFSSLSLMRKNDAAGSTPSGADGV